MRHHRLVKVTPMEGNAEAFTVRYFPEEIDQNTDESVVTNGLYDLDKFSDHESDVILSVLRNTLKKYPKWFRAIGLYNESYGIKYKPRYVLFEILIQTFADSKNKLDSFAVSLAYITKGFYFREYAIDFFEKSQPKVGPKLMGKFLNCSPFSVYCAISKLYESNWQYEKAIEYNEMACGYGDLWNPYFAERTEKLKGKIGFKPNRISRMRKSSAEFEQKVTSVAKLFIEISGFRK